MTMDIEKNSAPLILFYRQCCALAGDLYNSPMFPPAFLSVYNRVIQNQPRTNNAVESLNRRLNSTSRIIHPYFYKFTEIILKQQQFTEDNFELRISGNNLRKQKKHTIMLDKRIQTLVAQFSEMDLSDFLKGIANNMSHGLKKKRSLESDDDEIDDTQPVPKRKKFIN